jgi:ubiquitin-protein ligase
MSKRKLKRIINEIKELEDSKDILKQSGIYFNYDESNINNINVMFIGKEGTPYEKGFYFFELKYPDNYPMTPPEMKYNTQGSLFNTNKQFVKIRFNPNLYTNGKVCLSMLNTWKGPGWVPTNTVTNIFVAIQALVFNEEPLRNEPGFESSDKEIIDCYTKVINFANFKVALIDQINSQNENIVMFKEIMIDYYKTNVEKYDEIINNLCKNENVEIRTAAYGMNVNLDYEELKKYYEIFKLKIYNKE